MSTLEDDAIDILRHYPRIYIACHVDHAARRGQGPGVSARDQTILAHVPDAGVRPQALAAHLDIAASTMSEALARLVQLGLVDLQPSAADARGKIVRLTRAGKEALSKTSVLELERVRAALARLDAADRRTVVRGLELLADAAQALRDTGGEP